MNAAGSVRIWQPVFVCDTVGHNLAQLRCCIAKASYGLELVCVVREELQNLLYHYHR